MRQPLGVSVHFSRDCINIATERVCVYLDYNRIQTATGCISLFLIGLYWHYHLVYVYVNWRQWYWHSYWHYISWDCINVAKGSMCIIYICIYIYVYISITSACRIIPELHLLWSLANKCHWALIIDITIFELLEPLSHDFYFNISLEHDTRLQSSFVSTRSFTSQK